MSALRSRTAPAQLKNAIWGSEAEWLTLWHGDAAPVWPGDRVRFYEPADGRLIFVGIDDRGGSAEGGNGDS